MRISDWSSDVCSSDVPARGQCGRYRRKQQTCDNGQHPEIDCGTCHDGSQAQHAHCYMPRSEEHTSELQSLMRISYAVLCLKKKKDNTQNIDDKINIISK